MQKSRDGQQHIATSMAILDAKQLVVDKYGDVLSEEDLQSITQTVASEVQTKKMLFELIKDPQVNTEELDRFWQTLKEKSRQGHRIILSTDEHMNNIFMLAWISNNKRMYEFLWAQIQKEPTEVQNTLLTQEKADGKNLQQIIDEKNKCQQTTEQPQHPSTQSLFELLDDKTFDEARVKRAWNTFTQSPDRGHSEITRQDEHGKNIFIKALENKQIQLFDCLINLLENADERTKYAIHNPPYQIRIKSYDELTAQTAGVCDKLAESFDDKKNNILMHALSTNQYKLFNNLFAIVEQQPYAYRNELLAYKNTDGISLESMIQELRSNSRNPEECKASKSVRQHHVMGKRPAVEKSTRGESASLGNSSAPVVAERVPKRSRWLSLGAVAASSGSLDSCAAVPVAAGPPYVTTSSLAAALRAAASTSIVPEFDNKEAGFTGYTFS